MKLKDVKKGIMHVLSGTILTEDFFLKNTRFMFILFIIIVGYISNRYSCISKQAQIGTLKRELKDAKYESLTVSSELTGISRQTQVKALVEKYGMDLKIPTEPSFKVK